MKERWWKSKWSTQLATGLGAAALKSHTVTSSLRCDHSVTQEPGHDTRLTLAPWLRAGGLRQAVSSPHLRWRRSEVMKGRLAWLAAGGWRLAAAHWNIILSTRGSGARLHHGHCTFLQTRPGMESIIYVLFQKWKWVGILVMKSIEICPMSWWALAMLYIAASVFVGISRTPSCLGLVSGCCLVIMAYLQNGPNNYRSPYLWGAATV